MRINAISFFCYSFLGCSLLMSSGQASGQFVGNDSEAVDKRVNQRIGKMTLDEKIDLISGDTPFRTHAVPRLNIPFFQMADGPVGTRRTGTERSYIP